MTRHAFKWKEKQVQELAQLSKEYPVIAIASIERFPSALFQKLRKKLKTKSVIVKVSKTRIIKKAFQETGMETGSLFPYVEKSIAVVFSKSNPFELYSFVKKNKGAIYAKPGMAAEKDIVVPAGDTGLPPGPALSDLKNAGLKVRVQGATIAVTEDKVIAKKGELISGAVAGTLAKLEIKPIKVGLNITAAIEKGEVFAKQVLDIDAEKVFSDFVCAHQRAISLACEAEYFTRQTVQLLIARAFSNAKALAAEAKIPTKYAVQTEEGQTGTQKEPKSEGQGSDDFEEKP